MADIADDLTGIETATLRAQITDLRDALEAIRRGGVDAVIAGEPGAEQVYTLTSADRPYRVIVEDMNEGAATVSQRGIILYANPCFGRMLKRDPAGLVGTAAVDLVASADQAALAELLALHPGQHARAEINLASPDGAVPAVLAVSCWIWRARQSTAWLPPI